LKNTLAYYNAGVVVVNSEVVGLAPEQQSELMLGDGANFKSKAAK
jgi:hypothetical protein